MTIKLPRLGRSQAEPEGSAAQSREPELDDASILRRTRLRLMAVSGFVTLLILLVLGFVLYGAVSSVFTSDSETRLRDYANLVSSLATGQEPPQQSGPEFGGRYAGMYWWISNASGSRQAQSGGLPPDVPPDQSALTAALRGQTSVSDETITVGATRLTQAHSVAVRVYSQPIEGSDGAVLGAVQTVADRTQEANLLNLLRWVLTAGGGAALLAALAAGYLYAGRALVPIRASMERRQAALQRQREFTANASHELRTPLTVIRASVTDLMRNRRARVEDVGAALEDIDAEARHLSALVDDLLLLARTDSGVVQIERMPLDLADLAVEAASTLNALGEERDVRIEAEPLPATVYGDPLRLRQLVTILVDNAVRHSPPGSAVTVRVRPDGPGAALAVEDQGPGVRPEDMPRLFERFWRADSAPAGGTGLGLSIAKWIVEQHGGTIGASNREEGGARFWVRLPGVPDAAGTRGVAADDASDAEGTPGAPEGTPGAVEGPPAAADPNATHISSARDPGADWLADLEARAAAFVDADLEASPDRRPADGRVAGERTRTPARTER